MSLVLPALGGFRGEQTNREIASYWAGQLSQSQYTKLLKGGVTFALLDESTTHIYANAFLRSEKLSRLENEIIKLENSKHNLE